MKRDVYIHTAATILYSVLLLIAGLLCLVCGSCRSSSKVASLSTAELHEVSDTVAAIDTLCVTATNTGTDTASAIIREARRDTIRIDRDSVGRPKVIIWSGAADFQGQFTLKELSHFNLTGFHSSVHSQNTATLDHFDEEEKESTTEIHATLPIATVTYWVLLSLVVIYLIYIVVTNLWPHMKK